MKNRNDDDYYKELLMCVAEPFDDLEGRLIPVQLRIEEVELIEQALAAFQSEYIRYQVDQFVSGLEPSELNCRGREGLHSKIDHVFNDLDRRNVVIKKLLFKLRGSLEIALNRERSEPELGI